MIKQCVVCNGDFREHQGRKTCSKVCSKAHRKSYKREYVQNNKERMNETSRLWFASNREYASAKGKDYYRKNADRRISIERSKTAAAALLRLVETYGLDALNEGFTEPEPILKRRAACRISYQKNGRRRSNPEKSCEYSRKATENRNRALKLINEIQSKGLEALL